MTKNVVLPACHACTVPICFVCIVLDRESVVSKERRREKTMTENDRENNHTEGETYRGRIKMRLFTDKVQY